MTFQIPVMIRTANAGQATWLKRRAAARGMSAPALRRTGTTAASVSCPPTHTVAASTCRNSRIVSQVTPSMLLRPPRSQGILPEPRELGHNTPGPRSLAARHPARDAGLMAEAGSRGSSRPAGTGELSRRLVEELLAAATAAPSMHNTQPWRFRVRQDAIELRADPDRMLPVADPAGRAVHIACGAALLNLRLAAWVADREPVVTLLPDPDQP